MLTIIFVVVAAALLIGFAVWVVGFGRTKRRGQSGQAEVTAKQIDTKQGRAGGLD